MKILSPTYRLTITNSASNALQLVPNTPTRAFRVALLNVGSDTAAISFGTTATNMDTPEIGTTGNSGSFVLPPNMIAPIIIDCGAPDLYIKAIASGTANNALYLTLVAAEG